MLHQEAPKHQIITPGTAKDFWNRERERERECYRAILKIKAASIWIISSFKYRTMFCIWISDCFPVLCWIQFSMFCVFNDWNWLMFGFFLGKSEKCDNRELAIVQMTFCWSLEGTKQLYGLCHKQLLNCRNISPQRASFCNWLTESEGLYLCLCNSTDDVSRFY